MASRLDLGQIFVNNFFNRQLLEEVAFQLLKEVLHMHKVHVLKIENFVPCDMSLWSNGGSTGANSLDN